MSQNVLPFMPTEIRRYGKSLTAAKFWMLRLLQSRSIRRADGVIFLIDWALGTVFAKTGQIRGLSSVIPHGVNPRFFKEPKVQVAVDEYDAARPFRVLYVSIIDHYKHQWHVVEAIDALRHQGLPVVLDLVGPARASALRRLNQVVDRVDPRREWVRYHGAVPFNELHHHYALADIGLFASTCENMPNVLLETMASGLPIACSNKCSMPDMLGVDALYFDPEQSTDIADAVQKLIASRQLRTDLAQLSYQRARHYSWQRCSDRTFDFLSDVVRQHKVNLG